MLGLNSKIHCIYAECLCRFLSEGKSESKMELFAKIANGIRAVNYFHKKLHPRLDVWLSSEYVSA